MVNNQLILQIKYIGKTKAELLLTPLLVLRKSNNLTLIVSAKERRLQEKGAANHLIGFQSLVCGIHAF
jgi:hypothetical protein